MLTHVSFVKNIFIALFESCTRSDMKLNIEQILFQNISRDDFHQKYWNQKPLLIKNALPQIAKWADGDDLLDLASDPDTESQIVYNIADGYKRKEGPLTTNDLKGQYTFSCHGLNLLHENFKQLELAMAQALPHWQFDDIMTTVSSKGATLGAHYDHYSVFILQGHGKREWQLEYKPSKIFRDDQPVKLLAEFTADETIILLPGDILYIPPMCGHRGHSLEDSVSYSIGFKAFEFESLANSYLVDFMESLDTEEFYQDQRPKPGHKLSENLFNYFKDELQRSLLDEETLRSWLSSYLSTPKYPLQLDETADLLSEKPEVNFDTKFSYRMQDDTALCYLNNFYFECDLAELEELHRFMKSFDQEAIESSNLRKIFVQAGAFI